MKYSHITDDEILRVQLASLTSAHLLERCHRLVLDEERSLVGCFHCTCIFQPEYESLEQRHGAALCPVCGMNTLLAASEGFPITPEFLSKMRERIFPAENSHSISCDFRHYYEDIERLSDSNSQCALSVLALFGCELCAERCCCTYPKNGSFDEGEGLSFRVDAKRLGELLHKALGDETPPS